MFNISHPNTRSKVPASSPSPTALTVCPTTRVSYGGAGSADSVVQDIGSHIYFACRSFLEYAILTCLAGQFGGKKLQAMGRQNAVVSKARDVQKEAAKIGKQATDAKPPPKL